MVDFAELAQTRVGDVKRPPVIPQGHYVCQFSGPMKEHKAKSGNTAMRFPFKVIGAGDDVDQADLEAAGGIPEKEYNFDFWMSPDARYRFTEFGKAQGASDDLNLIELAEWLINENKPFICQASHRVVQKDGQAEPDVYIDWDNPAPAE